MWHSQELDSGLYMGFMENGQPEGYGRINYFNGNSYQGLWKTGIETEGHLDSSAASGKRYVGGWAHGMPSGFGIMVYLDNSKVMVNQDWSEQGAYYVGEWKEGLQNGKGTIYYSNGKISF